MYSEGGRDILDKENPLEFQDEEIGEPVQLFEKLVQRLSWNSVVPPGTERGNHAPGPKRLSGNFHSSNN